MPFAAETLPALYDHGYDALIDVRSPAEYEEDHLPGAINLPALSDEERARVGTIYKQESPFTARKIGAAMVARNVAAYLEGPLAQKGGEWRPLVYCWRGGQRSGSVATILKAVGWRAETLLGGYKSYRRLVVDALHEAPLALSPVLVDGYTGTAKTAILSELSTLGCQTLDLEGLARHRGSVLGGDDLPQPSQKAFESALAEILLRADPDRPTLLEAESSKIGDLLIPASLWSAMCAAPRLCVDAPLAARAEYLTRAYAHLTDDPAALVGHLERLIQIQGRARVEAWQEMARTGAFNELALELMREHYDPRYDAAARARGVTWTKTFRASALSVSDIQELGRQISDWVTLPEALRTEA